ncbi:MAG: CotH kinase family protein [Flavobacteriales bacterium]
MRTALFLVLLASIPGTTRCSAGGILINELQAAHRFERRNEAITPADWIELRNTRSTSQQLLGVRIVVNGVRHMIDGPLTLPPNGLMVLYCDGRTELGPDHLRFSLPRDSATVMVLAPDGATVLDSVVYLRSLAGESIGRLSERPGEWRVFDLPTPGRVNPAEGLPLAYCDAPVAIPRSGTFVKSITVNIPSVTGQHTRFTLDGSEPHATSPVWSGPLHIEHSTVIRARTFGAGMRPSIERCFTYAMDRPHERAIMITTAPEDLWNDSTGIYTEGLYANNTRTGRAWERPAFLSSFGVLDLDQGGVGMRISGSGSRGMKKRSLKLYARDAYDGPGDGFHFDGITCDEAMLRADATPNAFLHGLLVASVVRVAHLAVVVQPSDPVALYLNGDFWGLYRWMPPKDARWLRALTGRDTVEVLEGPALRALTGSNATLLRGLECMARQGPIDSIEALIDTRSLIDLACLDLFTGRADHDLNVRCFRPHDDDGNGTWRWVLFDMDLWSTPTENTVQRMLTAGSPEAPYLPYIMEHPVLRDRLLARMTALCATVLSAKALERALDSLYTTHRKEMTADHERWGSILGNGTPEQHVEELRTFIRQRQGPILRYLSTSSGKALRSVTVEVPPPAQGRVHLGGLPLAPGMHTFDVLDGVPLDLTTIVAPGMELIGPEGIENVIDLGGPLPAAILRPVLKPSAYSSKGLLQQGGEQ